MNSSHKTIYYQVGPTGLKKIAKEHGITSDVSFAKKYIRKGDKVLDLACGYGRVTIPLAKAGVDIVGIDLDECLIKYARSESKLAGLPVRFDIGNMTKLPYKSESFNTVLCLWNSFAELLSLQEQKVALSEIHRVLRDKGTAVLILPNGNGKWWKRLLEVSNEGRVVTTFVNDIPAKQYIHDKESVAQLLQTMNFSNYKVRHINMHKRRRILVRLQK